MYTISHAIMTIVIIVVVVIIVMSISRHSGSGSGGSSSHSSLSATMRQRLGVNLGGGKPNKKINQMLDNRQHVRAHD
jgi:preprotein translocase subunit SecG